MHTRHKHRADVQYKYSKLLHTYNKLHTKISGPFSHSWSHIIPHCSEFFCMIEDDCTGGCVRKYTVVKLQIVLFHVDSLCMCSCYCCGSSDSAG